MTWARLLLIPLLACTLSLQKATFAAAADDSGWITLSGDSVTVKYREGADELAQEVLERSETFLAQTSRFLGLPAIGPYFVVIASSREEFAELQPRSIPAPEWAGALTYPSLGLVLIMSPGAMKTGGDRYWSLLQHEMAHLLLGDAELRSRAFLPRWLQEGVATYVSGEMNLSRLLHLGWAQATGAAPHFRELEARFPQQPSEAEAAYARSYLFVKYLTRRFGPDAVALLVNESLGRGSVGEGVAAAFGLSLAELLEGFDQYARVKATWIPVITSSATIWGFITFLFLLTWYRKKVVGLRTLGAWDEEEAPEQGLDGPIIERYPKSDDEDETRSPTLH